MAKRNEDEVEYLESALTSVGQNLIDASNALADMDPSDKNYQKQAVAVSVLTKDFDALVQRYEEVMNPEPWYRKVDWGKIGCAGLVCGASMAQSLLIYKWQRDGYLMGRDAAKIQMPRPM